MPQGLHRRHCGLLPGKGQFVAVDSRGCDIKEGVTERSESHRHCLFRRGAGAESLRDIGRRRASSRLFRRRLPSRSARRRNAPTLPTEPCQAAMTAPMARRTLSRFFASWSAGGAVRGDTTGGWRDKRPHGATHADGCFCGVFWRVPHRAALASTVRKIDISLKMRGFSSSAGFCRR